MTFSVRAAVGFASAWFLVAGLTGCVSIPEDDPCEFTTPAAPPEAVKAGVVLVFQASKDFPDAETAIQQNSDLLSFLPADRESAPVQFSAVVADGAPAAVFQNWIQARSVSTDGDIGRQSEKALPVLASVYRCTFSKTAPTKALQDNVNLVAALDEAGRLLATVEGKREVHVFSNGYQTAGQPNFSQDFPANRGDADKTIDALEQGLALPNLDGIRVLWTGLGQGSPSTSPISQQAKNILEYFWATLIERSGGIPPEQFASAVLSASSPEGAADSPPLAEFVELCLFTLGPSSGFSFIPDTDDFINLDSAQKGAAKIAEEIFDSGCGDVRLSVTGYTASGTSKSNFDARPKGPDQDLSKDRAEAFAKLLKAEGLQVVDFIGAGKGPFNDWDDSGNFVPELGDQNRIVEIQEVR